MHRLAMAPCSLQAGLTFSWTFNLLLRTVSVKLLRWFLLKPSTRRLYISFPPPTPETMPYTLGSFMMEPELWEAVCVVLLPVSPEVFPAGEQGAVEPGSENRRFLEDPAQSSAQSSAPSCSVVEGHAVSVYYCPLETRLGPVQAH